MKRLNRKKLRGGEGRGVQSLNQKVDSYKYSGDLTTDVLRWGWRGCYGVYVSYVYIADSLTFQIPDNSRLDLHLLDAHMPNIKLVKT